MPEATTRDQLIAPAGRYHTVEADLHTGVRQLHRRRRLGGEEGVGTENGE
jgi:hypothetical protein